MRYLTPIQEIMISHNFSLKQTPLAPYHWNKSHLTFPSLLAESIPIKNLRHANNVFTDRLPSGPMSDLDGGVLNYLSTSNGSIILMGDFDAHTGRNSTPRLSDNEKTDSTGKALLAMCSNRGLRILNGSKVSNSGPTLARSGNRLCYCYTPISPLAYGTYNWNMSMAPSRLSGQPTTKPHRQ